MKRYIKIFALALSAALALISCNSVGDMAELPSGVLTITLDSGSMTTKADATAPTFETAIDHFDFFFFEDEDGTTPIPGIHGYVEGRTKVLNTAVGSEFETLRSRTSYVYIVANWPESFDHTRDWTLAQLLERRHQKECSQLRQDAPLFHSVLNQLHNGLCQTLTKF